MKLFENIIATLSAEHLDHEVFSHEPVFTSEQAGLVLGHKPEEGTKSLALQSKDGRIVIATVCGDERMDFRAIADAIGAKKVSMCPADVLSSVLGTEVGGLAPFGFDSNSTSAKVTLVVSERLLNQKTIFINPGKNDVSIKMSGWDFRKIMKAEGAVVVKL